MPIQLSGNKIKLGKKEIRQLHNSVTRTIRVYDIAKLIRAAKRHRVSVSTIRNVIATGETSKRTYARLFERKVI